MEKIKHYKILDLLGSGGMGKVYKAMDLMLERYVAIKVIHPHLWNDKKTDKRFIQEARAIARLVHPNIVTIYEVDKARYGRYIVMEFVQGTLLSQLLKTQGVLKPKYAVKLATQILSGLFCAHNFGVLHRDIKPANIIVTDNDAAKILDFGIAKMTANEGLTAAGDILGTVEYMAPEQMLGDAFDHRSDIYATGVVLYQILTNRLPFEGENAVEILYNIMNEDPEPPSYYNGQVGQELDQVVLKAISKTKEERWETTKAFSTALEAIFRKSSEHVVSAQTDEIDDLFALSIGNGTKKKDTEYNNLNSVFLGRDNELKRLVNLFKKASNSQGQTVILKGEAGVGKSTLANQLRQYVEQKQSWVLFGTCLYQEGLAPYLPFDDALRRFFSKENQYLSGQERREMENHLREHIPLLRELTEGFKTNLAPGNSISSENGDTDNDSLFKSLYKLISFLAAKRPVILIIDDLHWADEASLRLFHYLSKHIGNKRILLFGISRAENLDLQKNHNPAPFTDMLARMGREGIREQITLFRLTRENCDNLVDETLYPTLLTEEFYEFIYDETKGNPLFVLDTLKLMRESGVVFFKEGAWYNKQEGFKIKIPHQVEDVLTRRLIALNNEERDILRVAAVMGIKFNAPQLSQLLEMPKIVLLKILQRVENELQIIMSTEQGFHFEHPMLQNVLYSEMSIALRREYHLMIAAQIEDVYQGNFGDRTGEVARHFRLGGDHGRAVPLLQRAATSFFKLKAYREASTYIVDYLDSIECSGQSQLESAPNQDIFLMLGRCYEETGRWNESLDVYETLLKLSTEKAEPKNQIDALKCIGRLQIKLGDYETALHTYNHCLEIVEQYNIKNMYSYLYNSIGIIHREKGNLEQAQYYFEQTIQVVDNENEEYDKAQILMNLGIIANIRSDYNSALDSYEKALKEYLAKDDRKNQACVYHNIGVTYTDIGKYSLAIHAFERCLQLTNNVEDKQLNGLIYLNLGKVYARQENLAKAKSCAEKALKMFKLMGDILDIAEVYHVFGLIHGMQGNLLDAELFFNKSISINKQKQYLEGLAETYESFGNIYRKQGHVKRAKEYYEKAVEAYKKMNLHTKVQNLINTIEKLNLNLEHDSPVLKNVKECEGTRV